MTSTSIITAAWLFFAAWSAVLATLSVIAFGRDLFPHQPHAKPHAEQSPPDSAYPHPTAR